MNKENQIEEMGKIIGSRAKVEVWSPLKTDEQLAEEIYNAGYRKASDVAREIFEEIEEILIDNSYQISEELYDFYDTRGVQKGLAELKKKYTEGGE